MNKKKRIIKLENRIEVLEKQKESLETRVEVLDFKEEAKGAKFVIKRVPRRDPRYGWLINDNDYKISYLSEIGNKVITETFINCKETVTQHDKYLEFWRDGKITAAMRVLRDKLVEMDVDVYKKAFADWIAGQCKAYINISANVPKATDAFDALAHSIKRSILY